MNRYHYFLIICMLTFISCDVDLWVIHNDSTFVSYHFNISSLINKDWYLEKYNFITGDSLMFRLTSFQVLKDYNKIEPIDLNSISLTCDGDILIGKDTIHETENILLKIPNKKMIVFDKQQSSWPLYYDLIIQSLPAYKLKLNNGYYLFKIKAKTVNGFNASDSIVVKYKNR